MVWGKVPLSTKNYFRKYNYFSERLFFSFQLAYEAWRFEQFFKQFGRERTKRRSRENEQTSVLVVSLPGSLS